MASQSAIKLTKLVERFELEVLNQGKNYDRCLIRADDINRPALQILGFFDYFAPDRIQVIGKVEMTYLESIEPTVREKVLRRYLSYDLPCIVCCWGMTPPKELLQIATERDIPVFMSRVKTTKFPLQAIMYLNRVLAPHVTRHGVLVDVYGVGVLLTGESGVGKSEAALELVKRGHQLAADDVVDIRRVSDDRLVGESPELVRHFMEIRGVGIIDIATMYGVGAVIRSKTIDLEVKLENWQQGKEYDRLGLTDQYGEILGVKVPYILIPIHPGRNLAIVLEVAARNFRLKQMGYNAAQELAHRHMERAMRAQQEESEE